MRHFVVCLKELMLISWWQKVDQSFLFQVQMKTSLAKHWNLEVPTQVWNSVCVPSRVIAHGSLPLYLHTPSLYSFCFSSLLLFFLSQKPRLLQEVVGQPKKNCHKMRVFSLKPRALFICVFGLLQWINDWAVVWGGTCIFSVAILYDIDLIIILVGNYKTSDVSARLSSVFSLTEVFFIWVMLYPK